MCRSAKWEIGFPREETSLVVIVIAVLFRVSPSAFAQEKPQPPPADAPNQPSVRDNKKKRMEARLATPLKPPTRPGRAGELALVRARDWESRWFTGVFMPKGRTMTPLTLAQRRAYYLPQTLATPGAYMKRMFTAGIDQARGVPSQWDDGWAGYTERFASREGQFISANSLAALGNLAPKYEPRYDQCQCSHF